MGGISGQVELNGLDDLASKLSDMPSAAMSGVFDEVQTIAEDVLTQAQSTVPIGGAPTSPYDPSPGALLESGMVQDVSTGLDTVSFTISFGGSSAEAYAAKQEFEDWLQHKGGQQAHFLGEAINNVAGDFATRVAEAVQQAWAGL